MVLRCGVSAGQTSRGSSVLTQSYLSNSSVNFPLLASCRPLAPFSSGQHEVFIFSPLHCSQSISKLEVSDRLFGLRLFRQIFSIQIICFVVAVVFCFCFPPPVLTITVRKQSMLPAFEADHLCHKRELLNSSVNYLFKWLGVVQFGPIKITVEHRKKQKKKTNGAWKKSLQVIHWCVHIVSNKFTEILV